MTSGKAVLSILWLTFAVPNCFAQQNQQAGAVETSNFRWSVSPALVQKLGTNITAAPRISVPIKQSPNSTTIAVANQKRANSAPGNPVAAATTSPATSRAQQSQGKANPSGPGATGVGQVPHSLPCLQDGISDVDGSKSGVWFQPGNSFTIHGCGFGAGGLAGEAYLTGVKRQAAQSESYNRSKHPDWIRMLVPQGTWTDTQVQVIVDPNASGFYDAYFDATLLVIPSGKQPLSANGFSFQAAREEQTLPYLPLPTSSAPTKSRQPNSSAPTSSASLAVFLPTHVSDAHGHQVQVHLLTPSAGSIILPGHTIAVVRDDNAAGFPAGKDIFNLPNDILPKAYAFQVSGIQLFYTNLPPGACASTSNFSTSGNWSRDQTGSNQYVVSWQEQGCGNNGVSAYAIDVIVTGPKGVSPF
jgi:hypothetical protein